MLPWTTEWSWNAASRGPALPQSESQNSVSYTWHCAWDQLPYTGIPTGAGGGRVALVRIGFARKVSLARPCPENLRWWASSQQGSQLFPIPVIRAPPRPEHQRSRETRFLLRAHGRLQHLFVFLFDSLTLRSSHSILFQTVNLHPNLQPPPLPKSFTLLTFGRDSAYILITALWETVKQRPWGKLCPNSWSTETLR